MGASREQLLMLWQHKGRSILKFASPVFFIRLTNDQSKEIEDCQRKSFVIMAGRFPQLQQGLGEVGTGQALSQNDSFCHKVL
jgi:hypothetical protein